MNGLSVTWLPRVAPLCRVKLSAPISVSRHATYATARVSIKDAHHINGNDSEPSTLGEQESEAHSQLPFIAKKVKPSRIRKDYWTKMAMVDFGPGNAIIGRDLYQKLLELRQIHLTSWDDKLWTGSNVKLGWRIADQLANTVADLAAVLAGQGPQNKMLIPVETAESEEQGKDNGSSNANQPDHATKTRLLPVKVYWQNLLHRKYAQEWSSNVTHALLTELEAGREILKAQLKRKNHPAWKKEQVNERDRVVKELATLALTRAQQ